MVNLSKVLVLHAGEKDSYGKSAEAALALSLGKPVIFLCDTPRAYKIFQDIHPLTRMVDQHNGVLNGALVAQNEEEVVGLLHSIFHNELEFSLEQPKAGKFVLREKSSGSAYRIQTNDPIVEDTFWEHFQGQDPEEYIKRKPPYYTS